MLKASLARPRPHHPRLCWEQRGRERRSVAQDCEDQHLTGSIAGPLCYEKQANEGLSISLSRYRKIFKIRMKLPLTTMWITDDPKGKAKAAKRSLVLGWPTGSVLATFQ